MTADVQLRDLRPDDSDRLLAWRNQPDIRRWMYTDHVITPQEHARWLAAALADPARAYWVVELDGAPIGLANLAEIDREKGQATWAYYLADPTVRGRGVGAFVEHWVISRAFGPQGLDRLWCEVLADNAGVIKLHERFGFRRDPDFRKQVSKAGALTDVVGLALTAGHWAQVGPGLADSLRARGFPV